MKNPEFLGVNNFLMVLFLYDQKVQSLLKLLERLRESKSLKYVSSAARLIVNTIIKNGFDLFQGWL